MVSFRNHIVKKVFNNNPNILWLLDLMMCISLCYWMFKKSVNELYQMQDIHVDEWGTIITSIKASGLYDNTY